MSEEFLMKVLIVSLAAMCATFTIVTWIAIISEGVK